MTVNPTPPRRAVFIDKDGTLVHDLPYNVDPTLLCFTPHALQALRQLAQAGWLLILVSNQPGVAEGRFSATALQRLGEALHRRLVREGVHLAGLHFCPHARDAGCACRKPAPGLLHEAARAYGIDLAASWMVGDILDDVEAGHRAGCRSVLLDVGNETVWRPGPHRVPDVRCADLLAAARAIEAARRDGVVAPGAPTAPALRAA